MKKENCNYCALIMVLLAILVILVLIYFNKKSLNYNRVEGFDDHNNMNENQQELDNQNSGMEMMPPVPTNQPDAVFTPNSIALGNPLAEPKKNQYQVEYVRPITNEEFQEIFKDFYTTASDLAISTKKMKSLMDEYTQVYEENGKLQDNFNRLKDELQNGIKALS